MNRSLSLDAIAAPAPAPARTAAASPLRLVMPQALRQAPRAVSLAPSRRRGAVLLAMLALHGLVLFGLLNVQRVRDSVREAAPIFLAVLAPAAPTPAPRPLPPPARTSPTPPMLPLPLIAVTAAPAPTPLQAQLPEAPPPAAAAPATEAPAAPTPAAAARTIPASAVQYLVAPAPVYSRTSARLRESGRAVVRVWIDEAGLPREVQVAASSGFARLDDAALAAVRNARFKPYTENGVATAGWAFIPIEFELQT